jgi:hypothetical protein
MARTCDETGHRDELLSSEFAACYDCMNEFLPSDIEDWCDGGATALCPFCGLDFVVGFNETVDREWLKAASRSNFPWRYNKP